jgi:hypothetical protein
MGSPQRPAPRPPTARHGRALPRALLLLVVLGAIAAAILLRVNGSGPSPQRLVLSSPYVTRVQLAAHCDAQAGCPEASAWPVVSDVTTTGYAVGDTLRTTPGSWFGVAAPRGPRATAGYAYRWQRCRTGPVVCTDIPTARRPTYTLTPADVGFVIRVVVTAPSGGSGTQPSAPTPPIGGRVHDFGCTLGVRSASSSSAVLPVSTSGRLIRAIPSASAPLTALGVYVRPGGEMVRGLIYADSNGTPGALLGTTDPLAGAAASAPAWYTLSLPASVHLTAGVPYWLGVNIGAGPPPSRPTGGSGAATGAAVPVCGVQAPAGSPAGIAPPRITDITTPGAWAAGDTLSAGSGAWDPAPLAFRYQWQRCDSTGTACTDITGASANTYVLTAGELTGTLRVVVAASNADGTGSAASALAGSGPRTVSRSPNGPPTPAGGWSVAYADAFGASLGTRSGEDNTIWPSRINGDCTNNPGFNDNEMEVFNCSQVSVGPGGLRLTCQYVPHITSDRNYSCGAITTGGPHASRSLASGYRLFRFMPGRGPEWAIQIIAKFPPNTGEADPGWWSADPAWTWELDMFEGFGPSAGSGGTWCRPASGSSWVGITDPTWIFDTSTRSNIAGEQMLCRDAQPSPFDPSAGYHTYTTLIYPNARVSEYIDGRIQVWDSVPHGGAAYVRNGTVIGPPPVLPKTYGGLILSYALRDTVTGNPDPHFGSGARSMSVRSIAVYENTRASGVDSVNSGLVAPGTTLSP